jgi:hypothetical protein
METQQYVPLGTVVDLHVAGNNIKLLNVAMETQQYVTFVLLLTYMQLSTIQNC